MNNRRMWIVVAAAAAVLLVVFFVVQHLLNADTYRGRIEAALSTSLGRQVTLGHLSFSLFTGSLVADTPAIADDPAFSSQPFLTAKDIRIGVETGPLIFHRELHVTSLAVDEPTISLVRREDGTWNYSSLGSKAGADAPAAQSGGLLPNLTVKSLDIKDGTLKLGTLPAQDPPRTYTSLNLSARNFSIANSFPFTASAKLPAGGDLDISGTAGPVNPRDASMTPVEAQLSLKHTDLVAAGLVSPSQGVSGIADLDTKVVSNGQTAQAEGKLHVTQLKLAKNGIPSTEPVDLQFSVDQDLRSLSGRIVSATLDVAKATLALSGTYQTRGNATSTQIHIVGQDVPVDQLETFLPSLGIQLPSGSRLRGGTLTAALDVIGPVTAPVISGPLRLANTQLAGFDLGSRLSSIQALTGARTGSDTTIQALSTDLHYGPEGTRTDNLAVVVAGLGSAFGNGTITPAGALDYHLMVKLNPGGVGGIASQVMSLLPGAFGSAITQGTKNGIPLTIGGTTSSPTFTPDMSRMFGNAAPRTDPAANPLGNVLGGLLQH